MLISTVYPHRWAMLTHLVSSFFIMIIFSPHLQSSSQQQAQSKQSNVVTLYKIPSLPHDHYQFWLKNNPTSFKIFQQFCSQTPNLLELEDVQKFNLLQRNLTFEDSRYQSDFLYAKQVLHKICSSVTLVPKSCWGYQVDCYDVYLMPDCSGAENEKEQKIKWFGEVDFGYILDRLREFNEYCPSHKNMSSSVVSSLKCSKNLRVCRGDNLLIDLNSTDLGSANIDWNNLVTKGSIGGWNCDPQLRNINREDGLPEQLHSWYNELRHYGQINKPPDEVCGTTIASQVFFIRFDASWSMYDFFSTFINLYATMHLNNRFSTDNLIIVWGDSLLSDNFKRISEAFSRYESLSIKQLFGKRMCLKKFIFALPPTANDGFLHKSSLADGCSKSGLIQAFTTHLLHRMNLKQFYQESLHRKTRNNLIRITLMSRNITAHRAISNEKELVERLKLHSKNYFINIVDIEKTRIDHSLLFALETDILIGVHGSALTLALFLPKWATVIELHNCNDSRYANLARLSGLDYVAANDLDNLIEKIPISGTSGSDKKSNYKINLDGFINFLDQTTPKLMDRRAKYFPKLDPIERNETRLQQEASPTNGSTIPQANQTLASESNHTTSVGRLPANPGPVTNNSSLNTTQPPQSENPAQRNKSTPDVMNRNKNKKPSKLSSKLNKRIEL